MSDSFLPIPSLDNFYEIDKKGNVRKTKTKNFLRPIVQVKFNKKQTHRSVDSLLWEVHGIKPKRSCSSKIPVSAEKGRKKFFDSLRKCAKFLAKAENYCPNAIERQLVKRCDEIYGWKIKYFVEPTDVETKQRKKKG